MNRNSLFFCCFASNICPPCHHALPTRGLQRYHFACSALAARNAIYHIPVSVAHAPSGAYAFLYDARYVCCAARVSASMPLSDGAAMPPRRPRHAAVASPAPFIGLMFRDAFVFAASTPCTPSIADTTTPSSLFYKTRHSSFGLPHYSATQKPYDNGRHDDRQQASSADQK